MKTASHYKKTKSFHYTHKQSKFEFLYGILPVQNALIHKKRSFFHLYLKKGKSPSQRIEEIQNLAEKATVSISWIERKELDSYCPNALHQGCILKCSSLPYANFDSIVPPPSSPPVFLALDQINDPQNLGAIIRSCAFFKAQGIILPSQHSPQLTPTVSKTSAGCLEHFPIVSVTNLARFLSERKKEGYWVVGMDANAVDDLRSLSLDRPLILVMGNEGKGLRPLVQNTCDWHVKISNPQFTGPPDVSSLNVSNAAAIAMYQLSISIFSPA